jgi:sporulation protein YlmC with PRC-barrel domain
MVTSESVQQLIGADVVDPAGERIGEVKDVYLDDVTGEPSWVTVTTGWFGFRVSFVPLERVQVAGNRLQVPVDKSVVKDAPHFEAGEPLSRADENALYTYYERWTDRVDPVAPSGAADRVIAGRQRSRMRRYTPGAAVGSAPGISAAVICDWCGGYIAADRADMHLAFHREVEPRVGSFDRHDVPVEEGEALHRQAPPQVGSFDRHDVPLDEPAPVTGRVPAQPTIRNGAHL